MGGIPVLYGPSPVHVLSFEIGMGDLADLLIPNVADLLFRNVLSQKVPIPYGVCGWCVISM